MEKLVERWVEQLRERDRRAARSFFGLVEFDQACQLKPPAGRGHWLHRIVAHIAEAGQHARASAWKLEKTRPRDVHHCSHPRAGASCWTVAADRQHSDARDRALAAALTLPDPSLASGRRTPPHSVAPTESLRYDGAQLALPGVGCELAGGRFRLQRRIGRGGMGVVYEAFDAERGCAVALKVLARCEPSGISRFKAEFRTLLHVTHPSLVQLHELFGQDGHWYFTMTLVDGVHLDQWVRPAGKLDCTRLRSAFQQLGAAIGALHAAGKLHRDLKPSNVLVDRDGVVTVVDFGLVADWQIGGSGQTFDEGAVLGTPNYMAPEQATGGPATPASDHYALGVMLFEALTGRLPYEGSVIKVLTAKCARSTPQLHLDVPAELLDLKQLCKALLAHDPGSRPALDTLTASAADGGVPEPRVRTALRIVDASQVLLGRDAELASMRSVYAATLDGESGLLLVSGESGIGKTALCEGFLNELRTQGNALVLAGRCYERERVPFKAFDSLIDALARYLRRLPQSRAAALLPRHAFALARLFPVLGRVPVVADAPSKLVSDPHELQQLAFSALDALFRRIRDHQPLVLFVDDLHWTDHDSVAVLRKLLLQRVPLPVLFIACYREPSAEQNPLLTRVLDAAEARRGRSAVRIELGPLSAATTLALAERLLGGTSALAREISVVIAAEARGSPFLACALATAAARHLGDDRAAAKTFTVPGALAAQLDALRSSAQRLFRAIALIGQPLPLGTLLEATGSSHADFDVLRGARLVRTVGHAGATLVACYHDRIRECACDMLSAEQQHSLYASLSRALLTRGERDPELLYRCCEGAGDADQAAQFARLAADRAASSTAFDRAAELYGRALAQPIWESDERTAIEVELAESLARAGRGVEAAPVYLSAAAKLPVAQAFELRRAAAESLLMCGRVLDGEALLRDLCRDVGLRLPGSPRAAASALIRSQLKLRFRGLAFVERAPASLPLETQLRLDTARAGVFGFSGNQPLLAASMADRYLELAFDSGHAGHISTALSLHAYFLTLVWTGDRVRTRAGKLLALAEATANRCADPERRGVAAFARGAAALHEGQWAECRTHQAHALEILRGERSSGRHAWLMECAQLYAQSAAIGMGDYLELARTVPNFIEDAFNRGRTWGAVCSTIAAVPAWLAADDVSGLRRQITRAQEQWTTQADPGWPEYVTLLSVIACELYCGNPRRAYEFMRARWAGVERSLLLRARVYRVIGVFSQAGCALALYRESGEREPLAVLRRGLQILAQAGAFPGARAMHDVLAAGLALASGELNRAAVLLASATHGFAASDMAMLGAAARRRWGELIGGDSGRDLLRVSSDAMQAQGIQNQPAMTDMLCPGCRSR